MQNSRFAPFTALKLNSREPGLEREWVGPMPPAAPQKPVKEQTQTTLSYDVYVSTPVDTETVPQWPGPPPRRTQQTLFQAFKQPAQAQTRGTGIESTDN